MGGEKSVSALVLWDMIMISDPLLPVRECNNLRE